MLRLYPSKWQQIVVLFKCKNMIPFDCVSLFAVNYHILLRELHINKQVCYVEINNILQMFYCIAINIYLIRVLNLESKIKSHSMINKQLSNELCPYP